MYKTLINRIELGFWNLVIPLMTRSKTLRTLVKSAYDVIQNAEISQDLLLMLIVACMGFATGLLAYSITVLL